MKVNKSMGGIIPLPDRIPPHSAWARPEAHDVALVVEDLGLALDFVALRVHSAVFFEVLENGSSLFLGLQSFLDFFNGIAGA